MNRSYEVESDTYQRMGGIGHERNTQLGEKRLLLLTDASLHRDPPSPT